MWDVVSGKSKAVVDHKVATVGRESQKPIQQAYNVSRP